MRASKAALQKLLGRARFVAGYGLRLVSVSEEQTRRLGTGRFWVIDVEYRNQRGELCGVERWEGFGYRRNG